MALLLLRTVLGVSAIGEGACYLREPHATSFELCLGLGCLVAGVLFLLGFLTPIAAGAAAVGAIAVAESLFPVCTPNLFDSKLAILFASAILFSVLTLGPGAFSVDARLFGRREIIIPLPGPPLVSIRRANR